MVGIVYYANYLKFIDPVRSTWIVELGEDQLALQASGLVLAVRNISVQYLVPAPMGDNLLVRNSIIIPERAR